MTNVVRTGEMAVFRVIGDFSLGCKSYFFPVKIGNLSRL
jgi:hypothetical protein